MDIHGIILIVLAGLELALLVYLLFTRSKGHVLYSFTIFTLGVIFWVMGNGLFRLVKTNGAALFWTNLNYIAALAIAIGLVYFSFAFPYLEKQISKCIKTFWIIIFIAVGYLMFFTNIIIDNVTGPIDDRYVHEGSMHIIYSIVFLLLFIWALVNLYRKYKTTSGFQKWQIGVLLIGLVGSGVIGTLFNLFLPSFGGPQYFYLGPESSVIWLGLTSYIVFKKT